MREQQIGRRSGFWLAAMLLLASVAHNSRADEPAADKYTPIVEADKPVARWRLDDSDGESIRETVAGHLTGRLHGRVGRGQAGARPPEFPLFTAENGAVEFFGDGSSIRIADPGENSPLDFGAGDALTLEAWVNPQKIKNGQQVYIVGKGRTGNAGFPAENQNYALRLRGVSGTGRISFLFRSASTDADAASDYHRWTSKDGIAPGSGWHHVAVSYTFGKSDSLRAYLNGEPISGTWDMGGATGRPPVVDNDELWIGSSMGGNPESTFHGQIDEVAIYRAALPAPRIAARFQFVDNAPLPTAADLPTGAVLVQILEGVPDVHTWNFRRPAVTETYTEPTFGFVAIPQKYAPRAGRVDRASPIMIRATGIVRLPAGEHRWLLRSRSSARLVIDGNVVAQTPFRVPLGDGHHAVYTMERKHGPDVRPVQPGDQEQLITVTSTGAPQLVMLETIIGGRRRRPEVGELGLWIGQADGSFRLLVPHNESPSASGPEVLLTDAGWLAYAAQRQTEIDRENTQRRRAAAAMDADYWQQRHALARLELERTPAPAIPDVAHPAAVQNAIDRFINPPLVKANLAPQPLVDDWGFVRRVSLDVIGTIPTPDLVARFFADEHPDRRARFIDHLLEQPGWADHWVGYWQDVLAENPNIVNPTLNNSGPFRWWIHESFTDNTPFDRWVTELILMEGSAYFGGPAGFEMATESDAPLAEKAHILGQGFLAVNMKCARCHDAPYHDIDQRQLFSTAALLGRKPQQVPAASTIPADTVSSRSLLVEITLKAGESVAPEWTFAALSPRDLPAGVVRNPADLREQLAGLVTGPQNSRFPQVIVNRMWQRYLGRGLVEPVDDWEMGQPSHPELLQYLARELVRHDYDLKHVARLILNSHTYQRRALAAGEQARLFAGPVPRRMTAEQLVDSLFTAAGKEFDCEELNVDVDNDRVFTSSLNLGVPRRAWQMTSMSNERDRPSLSLPRAQTIVDVLEAFGWRGSRQSPLTVRETDPNILQPAIVANGVVGTRVARLSDDSAFTALSLADLAVDQFIERVTQRILTRPANSEEQRLFADLLAVDYDQRRAPGAPPPAPKPLRLRTGVSWSNHLQETANRIQLEVEREARAGDPPTRQLTESWRERAEDMVWTLLNSPEFMIVP